MLERLKQFLTRKSSLATQDSALFQIFLGGVTTRAGTTVSPETAMACTAVSAAVRTIAESLASLPLHIYRKAGTARELALDHPAYALLNAAPNGWSSSYDLRNQLQTDVLLRGNGYGFVNRVNGKVHEIIRMPPGAVTVTADAATGEPTYSIAQQGGGTRDYSAADVVHIKATSLDGVVGVAPIVQAREAIGVALALEAHSAMLLGNGGRPSGILSVDGIVTPAVIQRVSESWHDGFTPKGGGIGRTAVFDKSISFTPLSYSSVDMQFLELRRFAVEEISRAFRVPPHLLSELGRATWSNAAEMGQAFLDYTLMPWLLQWQGALTRAILTPTEQAEFVIEFDPAALTKANLTARFAAYQQAAGGPWMTPNEVRALENFPPVQGGDGLNATAGAPAPANDNSPPQPETIAA